MRRFRYPQHAEHRVLDEADAAVAHAHEAAAERLLAALPGWSPPKAPRRTRGPFQEALRAEAKRRGHADAMREFAAADQRYLSMLSRWSDYRAIRAAYWSRALSLPIATAEGLVQSAWWRAALRWDPTGATFHTCAVRWELAAVSAHHEAGAPPRSVRGRVVSLDALTAPGASRTLGTLTDRLSLDPVEPRDEGLLRALSAALSVLTDRDRAVLMATLEEVSLREMGPTMGVSSERCRQISDRAFRIVRDRVGAITGLPVTTAKSWRSACGAN